MTIFDQCAFYACLSGSLEKAAIAGRAIPVSALGQGGPFVDPASGTSARFAADHGADAADAHLTSKHREPFARPTPDSQRTGLFGGVTAASCNLMTGVSP
ncbi:MAG: hypothetical protein KDK24_07700 [Pseudooceanicola sp.]|nr:hypothetical protein [Pseudooceanicola sp.]